MTTRTKLFIIIPVVVLVAAVAGGLWWFFKDDAPDEVSLSSAIESVETTTTGGGPSTDEVDTTDSDADGIAGIWVVDAESGEFDFESATGTFAGFRIAEELASIGSSTAVGRTGDVSGAITIDGTTLTEAEFEVDLTTITTNESRRDDRVQSALETDSFPVANFVLTEPVDLGASAVDGEPVAVTATGDLTVHGVTQSVVLPIEAQLVDGTVVVVGSLDIVFADFDVAVPSSPVVVSVEDNGVLEVQLLLVKE